MTGGATLHRARFRGGPKNVAPAPRSGERLSSSIRLSWSSLFGLAAAYRTLPAAVAGSSSTDSPQRILQAAGSQRRPERRRPSRRVLCQHSSPYSRTFAIRIRTPLWAIIEEGLAQNPWVCAVQGTLFPAMKIWPILGQMDSSPCDRGYTGQTAMARQSAKFVGKPIGVVAWVDQKG